MLFFSFILNCTICVTIVGFGGFHLKMALTNETTIEPGSGCSGQSRYHVGWRANLESVLGDNPRLWLLPVYGNGPTGDGIHWPEREAAQAGGAARPGGAAWPEYGEVAGSAG